MRAGSSRQGVQGGWSCLQTTSVDISRSEYDFRPADDKHVVRLPTLVIALMIIVLRGRRSRMNFRPCTDSVCPTSRTHSQSRRTNCLYSHSTAPVNDTVPHTIVRTHCFKCLQFSYLPVLGLGQRTSSGLGYDTTCRMG
jgi:hypothetical protein